jgi:hypothetical protein
MPFLVIKEISALAALQFELTCKREMEAAEILRDNAGSWLDFDRLRIEHSQATMRWLDAAIATRELHYHEMI